MSVLFKAHVASRETGLIEQLSVASSLSFELTAENIELARLECVAFFEERGYDVLRCFVVLTFKEE